MQLGPQGYETTQQKEDHPGAASSRTTPCADLVIHQPDQKRRQCAHQQNRPNP